MKQLENLKRSVAASRYPQRTALKVRILEIEQELLSRNVDGQAAPMIDELPADSTQHPSE